jgi:hypothetical protein
MTLAPPGDWSSDLAEGPASLVVPLVIAIDVEPDGRATRPGGPMPLDGFALTAAWLASYRPRLEDATGRPVRYAWFVRMDPQITSISGRADGLVSAIRPVLETLRANGDSLGLHTHGARWRPEAGWLVDHGDPAWIEHCLRSGYAAFEAAFGEPCRQHRFGDRWTSPAMFDILAELGTEVDLTIEPGQRAAARVDPTAPATGQVPSYLRSSRRPHRHAAGPLWLLPLSAADPAPTLPTTARLARRLRYLAEPRHRPLLLDRRWPSPEAFWSLVERHLGDSPTPYLAFAIRSDLWLRPRATGVEAILGSLLRRPLVHRLVATDGVEALALLKAAATAEAVAGAGRRAIAFPG